MSTFSLTSLENSGAPARQSKQKRRKTFNDRLHEAEKRRESRFVAALAHLLHDMHPDPYGYDQWYLAIILATALGYLYTRNVLLVIVIYAVWYFFENFVWFSIGHFSRGARRHLHAAESRDRELIVDPVVFALALATNVYVFEHSFVRTLLGEIPPVPIDTLQFVSGAVVAFVASCAGYPHAFWWMLAATLAAIWIVFAFDSTHEKLVLALTASIITVYHFLWFVRPIARHFLYNALYAIFAMGLIVSVVDLSDPILP